MNHFVLSKVLILLSFLFTFTGCILEEKEAPVASATAPAAPSEPTVMEGSIPSPSYTVVNYNDPTKNHLSNADPYSRMLLIESHEFDSVGCSHDGGETFAACDLGGNALIWTKEDWMNNRTVVIRFSNDDGSFEDYSYSPTQEHPDLIFHECDHVAAMSATFGVLQSMINSAMDVNSDGERVICLGPNTVFSHANPVDDDVMVLDSNVTLIGTHFLPAKIYNYNANGETTAMRVTSWFGQLLNLKIETNGLFGYGLKFDPGSWALVDGVSIKTTGSVAYGIFSEGAMVEFHAVQIETSGVSSAGIYASSSSFINGYSSTIETTGSSSTGVYVTNSSIVSLMEGCIVETTADSSSANGVYVTADSAFDLQDGKVESHGAYTPAIFFDNLSFMFATITGSEIIAHTDSSYPAIYYVGGGQMFLYDSEVTNSGHGLEILGNDDSYAYVDMVTFKMAANASSGNKYGIKVTGGGALVLESVMTPSILACNIGQPSFTNLFSGNFASGSFLVGDHYNGVEGSDIPVCQ